MMAKLEKKYRNMRPATAYVKKKARHRTVVAAEIGCCRGENAQNMLDVLNIKFLYLIDLWGPYEQRGLIKSVTVNFEKEYQKVLDKFKGNPVVQVLKGDSLQRVKQFRNKSLDFIYIDGNHNYEAVKADIEAWYPKLRKNGVMAGHDYEDPKWPGVKKAVDEWAESKGIKIQCKRGDWWYDKAEY
jgi:hypothetical protein